MIKSKRRKGQLIVRLFEDWNWTVSKELEDLIGDSTDIVLHLEHARWIDSEGIRTLCKWVSENRQIRLNHPPKIYFEIVELLELEGYLKDVVIKER